MGAAASVAASAWAWVERIHGSSLYQKVLRHGWSKAKLSAAGFRTAFSLNPKALNPKPETLNP